MKSDFNAEFFRGNRERLRALFTGTAPIIIGANGLLQRNSDMEFPFRQESNFWYLTGIEEPDCVLVIDKNEEYVIIPERDTMHTVFGGAIEEQKLTERSGIETILDGQMGWRKLATRLKRVKHIATLPAPAAYIKGYDFYSNPARAALMIKLKSYNENLELLDLRDHFLRLRSIKQPEELASLQKSIDTTVGAFQEVVKRLHSFKHEYEIEAAVTGSFRKKGARHGYNPIVAGGLHACTLHYSTNQSPLNQHELVLIDVGAEHEYYSADITRTYAIQESTKRQQSVMEAVVEVQDYAMSLIKAGASIKNNEQLIEQFMGEKLRALGLIKTIDHENVRTFFPHSTSHFLGVDVHDVGDYQRPLEAGMVLTVEPGIYIPKENIGVRIEDNILVTKDGFKNLSGTLAH